MSFDRAAGYYDATRGLSEDVVGRMSAVLATELRGRGPCLEIGVGTGRIALPLSRSGVPMLGADLSLAMLEKLRINSGGLPPFPIAQADVTALPLAGSSVGAVLASHVFHLIPNWPEAVDEARRVLTPDGVLLVDFGGPTPAPWSDWCMGILAAHGISRIRPGLTDLAPLADHLGRSARALERITFEIESTLGAELDEWENQILAWTWIYPPEQMRRACGDIRRQATARGWSLDEKVTLEARIQWWAFDRP